MYYNPPLCKYQLSGVAWHKGWCIWFIAPGIVKGKKMENSTRNIEIFFSVVCSIHDCVSEWLLLSGWYVRIFHLNFFVHISPSTTTLVKQKKNNKAEEHCNEIMD